MWSFLLSICDKAQDSATTYRAGRSIEMLRRNLSRDARDWMLLEEERRTLAAGIVWVQVGPIGASLAGQCVEDVGDRNNTNELARRGWAAG